MDVWTAYDDSLSVVKFIVLRVVVMNNAENLFLQSYVDGKM